MSGEFLTQKPERLRQMLELDIVSLMELTHLFGNRMSARGAGHILLVASLAAYGAAKHFVLAFGVALHVELAPRVGVTVVSPGLMDTGFNEVASFQPMASLRPTLVSPDRVAEVGLRALFAGRSSVVVGRLNRLAAFSNRFLSRSLQAKLTYRMTK